MHDTHSTHRAIVHEHPQRPRLTRRTALQTWITGSASLLLLAACGGTSGAGGETAAQAAATAAAKIAQVGPLGTGPVGTAPGSAPAVSGQPATGQPGTASQAKPASSGAITGASQQLIPSCVLTPQQTEGPYFVDERLNRSDIRPDPVTGAVSEGMPLKLQLQVAQVEGSTCTPMSGIFVDIWQCDAYGVYSDVNDRNTGSRAGASKFLRGYQVTDDQGRVEFLTVYPGWYSGRAVHIHFKVRTALDGNTREQVSQFYFDDALSDQIHALPPYSAKGTGRTRNDRDGIYRNGGTALTVPVVQDGDTYVGTYTIGVQLT